MIELFNFSIKFDRPIINNGNITIKDGSITAITGDSGTGKSSVLYLLGLISSNRDYEYYYYGKRLNLKDNKGICDLRRKDFGFLLQDNSLIDNLTVEENMRYTAQLAEIELSRADMVDYLRKVDLSVAVLECYPKQLSGGEQQRAALATILAKRPKYIFADEPTSALDKKNTQKIISIFQTLANEGISIVVATHSNTLRDVADTVYNISDNTIELLAEKLPWDKQPKGTENEDGNIYHKRTILDRIGYAIKSNKKNRGLKWLITAFCALAITGFSLTNSVLDSLRDTQSELMNQISDREVFVLNQTSDSNMILDRDGYKGITQEDKERIETINGVETIRPYYEFRSFNLIPGMVKTYTDIDISIEGKTTETRFSLDDSEKPYFIVVPYDERQRLGERVEVNLGSEAAEAPVYVTHSMSHLLGLSESSTAPAQISFEIGVPVRKVSDTAVANGVTVSEDLDVSEFVPVSFTVSGILDESVVNRYSINGSNIVYVPYEKMDEILNSTKAEYASKDYSNMFEGRPVKEWNPSSYLVYTTSYGNVDAVRGKVENINPDFITKSDYQDTASMEKIISKVKSTSDVVLIVLLVIIFVLMSAVFIYITFSRRREFAILKANGMSNSSLAGLMVTESVIQGLKIIIIATILALILSTIGSTILLAQVSLFSAKTIILVAISSVAFVCIPTIVSVSSTLRLEPDKILRN